MNYLFFIIIKITFFSLGCQLHDLVSQFRLLIKFKNFLLSHLSQQVELSFLSRRLFTVGSSNWILKKIHFDLTSQGILLASIPFFSLFLFFSDIFQLFFKFSQLQDVNIIDSRMLFFENAQMFFFVFELFIICLNHCVHLDWKSLFLCLTSLSTAVSSVVWLCLSIWSFFAKATAFNLRISFYYWSCLSDS